MLEITWVPIKPIVIDLQKRRIDELESENK